MSLVCLVVYDRYVCSKVKDTHISYFPAPSVGINNKLTDAGITRNFAQIMSKL